MKRLSLLFLLACLIPFYSCDEPLDPEIRLFENEYSIGAEGGELIVRFAANVEVSVSANVGWITVMDLDEMNCLLSVDPNPEGTERTGKVVFSNYENGITSSVWVNQEAGEVVTEEKSELEFEYTAQTFTVNVTSLSEPEVKTSADWISYTGATSGTNKVLSFSLEENQGKEPRQADVRITAGKQVRNIAVTQLVTTYAPATKEEIEKSEKMGEEVANSVQNILSGTSESTPAQTIAEQIEQLDEVVYAHADDEGENIRFMKRDSTFTTVVLHPEKYGIDVKAAEGQHSSPTRSKTTASRSISSSEAKKKVLLLSPFNSAYYRGLTNYGSRDVNYEWMEEQLGKVGVKLYYYLDDKADLNKFRADTLAKYDMVLIRTHGGSWTYQNTKKNFTVCTTGQSSKKQPEGLDPKLYSKLETLIFASSNLKRYVITEKWLEATCGDSQFNSTIIYNGSCLSFANRDFSDFFTRKGASGYYGFTDEIDYHVSNDVMYSICISLCRGMTITKAFNYTKKDKELFDSDDGDLLREHMHLFDWYIDPNKSRYALVDPTPFNLDHTYLQDKLLLKWNITPTIYNALRYTVVTEDGLEYDAGSNLSVKIPYLDRKDYKWRVRADLYVLDEKIDSYNSEMDAFSMDVVPYFSVTTGTPTDTDLYEANIPVSYDTNMDLHLFEGGIIYSTTNPDPIMGMPSCVKVSAKSVNSNPFTVNVNSLEMDTKYYARGYIVTGNSPYAPSSELVTYLGNVIEFKTPAPEITPVDSGLSFADSGHIPITSYQFGEVAKGTSQTEVLLLQNLTHETHTVHIKSVPSGFKAELQGDLLYPSTSLSLVITFTPSEVGNYSGNIVFDLGAYYNPIVLPISGIGIEPPDQTVPVTGVTLDKQELTLTVGDKYTLQASIKPANATNKDVTWKSLDTTVATVSNGVVTAIKPGQANIVVTTVDGSHTALCRVTVRTVNGGHEGTVEEDWGNN